MLLRLRAQVAKQPFAKQGQRNKPAPPRMLQNPLSQARFISIKRTSNNQILPSSFDSGLV